MTDVAGRETLASRDRGVPSEAGTFETPDGLRLFEQSWVPETAPEAPPRAAVALVHGYGEHSGRYAHVAAFLTARGHAVYAFDQRGYGRSEGRRAFVDRFEHYLDDLSTFLRRVRDRAPGVPLFLMGHSMGGTVCARYWLEHRPDVAGLILSSPFLHPGEAMPHLPLRLSSLASRLFPTFPTVRIRAEHLSRDQAVRADVDADPLNVRGRVRARTGHEMVAAAASIRDRLEAVTLPFLVFHGTADCIADPRGSIELYRRALGEDKTLGLYEGLFHETLNEPERTQVLHELAAWLEEHL